VAQAPFQIRRGYLQLFEKLTTADLLLVLGIWREPTDRYLNDPPNPKCYLETRCRHVRGFADQDPFSPNGTTWTERCTPWLGSEVQLLEEFAVFVAFWKMRSELLSEEL
jgi:hypothetical protein